MRAQQQQPQVQPQAMAQPVAAAQAGAPEQPYVAIRPATNSLLVNATAEQHEAIELVIAHVDVVQKDQRTIRQYEIQHVDTQEIMDTMADLGIVAPQQDSYDSSMRSGYGGYDSRSGRSSAYGRNTQQQQMMMQQQQPMAEGAVPMALPTAEGGSEIDITAEQPQIAVLRATNSLLVFATPRQHDAIALVIAHADRVPEVASTPYVVYALENQDPLDLAEVLTKLIQETVEEQSQQSSPDSKIQTTTVKTSVIPTLEEEKIRIIPDEMSYSLIVYANKRNQQWVSELIKQLDEYRPQVLLDCTLVVINKDETFKYDMDIVSKTHNDLTLRSPSPITTISGNFSEQTYGEGRVSSGNFTGFFNSDMVQALLEMVQTKNYGRVMARPKILVNDNQEGEIKTENTTSIAQQKSIIQPGTDTGQTITTTDVSFAEYSEGVTLKIKPHISKGDMLRLEITLGRSDFQLKADVTVAGETYPRPPDILSTDVTTVATVPDGTTIILGGLEGVDQQKSTTKVPILGDIPIVGGLFRGIDDIGAQSKLYVFVKANVLRPSDQLEGLEDIRRVSGKYRREFENMEKSFQEHEDWPGVKPKPMEPAHVLEEDDFINDSATQEQQ
jgi:general secretion pathway protein D